MNKKHCYAHIFTPIGGKWKSVQLKHWYGKRVNINGHYGKIVNSIHDFNMNFLRWTVYFKKSDTYINIKDPAMIVCD